MSEEDANAWKTLRKHFGVLWPFYKRG
jgi:hypothetical protein